MSDVDPIHVIHSVWSAILTLLGGVGTMFIKNIRDDIKGKADKSDVDQKHADNLNQFNKIGVVLDRIDAKIDLMAETVAVLKDRAGMSNGNGRK